MMYNSVSAMCLVYCSLVILFVGLVIIPDVQGQRPSFCTTPDLEPGTCIHIRNCQTLVQLLIRERPPSVDTVEFLKRSTCGTEDRRNPRVCCPQSPTTSNPFSVSTGSSAREAIDFTNQRNRNLLPSGLQCGVNIDDKVIKGVNAALGQYPWMARLGYQRFGGSAITFQCGGSLVNNRYVLTAAHCLVDLGDRRLALVRLGDLDSRTDPDCGSEVPYCAPAQDFLVERFISHRDYTRTSRRNDIGLVRLNRDVTISELIAPICLPFSITLQMRSFVNTDLDVAGWGATETAPSSDILQVAKVPIVVNEICQQRFDGQNSGITIFDSQICAGGFRTTDSCGGDSGGPLMHASQDGGTPQTVQIGIVSYGPRACGNDDRPGVYTRVSSFLSWILANIES